MVTLNNLRIRLFIHNHSSAGSDSKKHRHNSLEILYTKKGQVTVDACSYGSMALQDEVWSVTAGTGQFVTICPGILHQQHFAKGSEYLILEFASLPQDLPLTNAICDSLYTTRFTQLCTLLDPTVNYGLNVFPDNEGIEQIFERLIEICRKEYLMEEHMSYFSQEADLLCNYLFLKICRCQDLSASRFGSNHHTRRAYAYICQNFHSLTLSVPQIASYCGLSKSRLNILFQEDFGSSVWNTVIQKRLNHAAWLLMNTGDSIEQIARKCGYSSPRAFQLAFKKQFGDTPSDYRENSSPIVRSYLSDKRKKEQPVP